MPTVKLSGPNNSTLFTTCYGCAICDDQRCCPGCGEEVTPTSESKDWATWRHQNGRLRWEAAYGPTRRMMQRRDRKLKAEARK